MRRVKPIQLQLVFADSPQGGATEPEPGVPEEGPVLLLRTSARKDPGYTTVAVGRLLVEVASPLNLRKALLHVARNNGAAGVDGKSVKEVLADANRLSPLLRSELLMGRYRPGDVKRVWIPKPGGGQRGLGIPNVIDRWVQQAVHQVIGPIFEPTFHECSHGFRPQRGAKTALATAEAHIADGREWVTAIDLSKFFDRVDHQRLLARLGQKIEDGQLLRLIHLMLKANVVLPNGVRTKSKRGTPQGGPLSPLLSNIVLNELDWEMDRRGLRFVRYADDFNIYVRSKRAGERVMESLNRFIEGRLRLKVNAEKSTVARSETIHFLGFHLHPQVDGTTEVTLSTRSKKRIYAKLRVLAPRNWGGSLDDCIENANRYLQGWFGYFRLCTGKALRLFQYIDAHLRRRIRAIIATQKGKRPRFLYRHLLSRGVSPGAAGATTWSNRGPWKQSNLPGMTRAYPNAWFRKRLKSLELSWLQVQPKVTDSGQVCLPGM